MLKNIPSIIPPDLLKFLCEMGHGDEIVIADGNFPSAAYAQRLVRLDGHGTKKVLDAVLGLIKLDIYVEKPIVLMQTTNGDKTPEIWAEFENIILNNDEKINIELIERFAFYERAKKAYVIVATGDKALYANILLKKGVI